MISGKVSTWKFKCTVFMNKSIFLKKYFFRKTKFMGEMNLIFTNYLEQIGKTHFQ
jgi:hypothetical protein